MMSLLASSSFMPPTSGVSAWKTAIAQHGIHHGQVVATADDVVVLAMRGRGVHGACAGFQRHMGRQGSPAPAAAGTGAEA